MLGFHFSICNKSIFFGTKNLFVGLLLKPLQDGRSWGCSQIVGQKGSISLKFVSPTRTMMKPGTIMLYLKKIQKIYKSRDIFLEFC